MKVTFQEPAAALGKSPCSLQYLAMKYPLGIVCLDNFITWRLRVTGDLAHRIYLIDPFAFCASPLDLDHVLTLP